MKLLVPVKRVVDYNIKPRVKSDGSSMDIVGLKMSINPFDETALEEAIRLKEKSQASEITVVTIGKMMCQDVLRTAMAMGGDKAILVETDQQLEPLAVAKVLKKVVEQENPDIVLMGKQAIDDDMNATGQILAGLLGWGQGTFASKVDIVGEWVTIMREVDEGVERIRLRVPAVITADLRLNEPRYITLPNIMKARKKPIHNVALSSWNVDLSPRLNIMEYREPAQQRVSVKLNSVEELVEKLCEETRIL